MTHEKFNQLVGEALDNLPKEFAEKLDNVAVVVEDEPSAEQMKKLRLRGNVLLLGLYEGIPQPNRGFYAGVLPDKITIFKNSIEKVCSNEEEIKEQVRKTVIHEIGHHFGLSEEELH